MQKLSVRKIQKKKGGNIFSGLENEIIGILLLGTGLLFALSFFYEEAVGIFGNFIRNLFLGLMGMPALLIPSFIIVYAIFVIFKKNNPLINRRIICIFVLLLLISCILHIIHWSSFEEIYENRTFWGYMSVAYEHGKTLDNGGLIGGLVTAPLLKMFYVAGTSVIIGTFLAIDIILLLDISLVKLLISLKNRIGNYFKNFVNRLKKIDIAAGEGIEGKAPGKKKTEAKKQPVEEYKDAWLSQDEEPDPINFFMKDIKNDVEINVKKAKKQPAEEIKVDLSSHPGYKFPSFDLLNEPNQENADMNEIRNAALEGARKLEETLSSFGVNAKVINISRGPTITRYELQPSPGVKVSRIVNLSDDISLNLASMGVRIEAPIPGKAAIGIEVPNKEIATVTIREVLESPEFSKHPSKLAFALGKDISGECIVADIAKMPHLLIAGQTGAGKSVCINNLIISILYKAAPDEVKLLLIDPKVVELGVYNGIPHLLIPVVTDPKKAAGALNWAVQEMVDRYKLFAEEGVKDIKGYNNLMMQNSQQLLPQIVIIIDELADLMMVAPNDVEDAICRLTQMARAAGMHLVIATQRPSVDVITGVIKANIPSRIAFAVASQVDSRTILDMAGAEKLLGKGDMLFHPSGKSKPVRIQGALVLEDEIDNVIKFVKEQGETQYDNNIIEEIESQNGPAGEGDDDADELLPEVIEMVVDAGQASVSMVQRRFRVGYARAARIIDQMQQRGIVGGFEGSKPRQVLITKQQLQEMKLKDDDRLK
ncbi:MAG TPA: DNA translocase FtsK [Clostridiaceae bacterium]|nr:DNA translocase FtsK [Clostridiaceae bacterium]